MAKRRRTKIRGADDFREVIRTGLQPDVWKSLNNAVVERSSGKEVLILGRCRRHSPTINGYPVVTQNDWCGDHKLMISLPLAVNQEQGDVWAHRSAAMRCAGCMYFVEKHA